MPTIEVDDEVYGHLLILHHKRGGSLSEQIEYLLTKVDDQFQLPLTANPNPYTFVRAHNRECPKCKAPPGKPCINTRYTDQVALWTHIERSDTGTSKWRQR